MMFQQMTLNVFQTCGHRLLCTFNVWGPTETVATRPLFMLSNPGSYKFFYTFDGNKNVLEMVHFEQRNGIAAHYDYAPFGAVTRAISTSAVADNTFTIDNPFRFSSEYHDDTLGLVYYNYRHYNPIDGRWCGRDPLEEGIFRINLFLFSQNSPIGIYDQLGLKCHIIRFIGHFAGKNEEKKGAVWNYLQNMELDDCDTVFSISCHMDEFLEIIESSINTPAAASWPPKEFGTGTITACAFPFLLKESDRLIERIKRETRPSCCCEDYQVETVCDKSANEDFEKILKLQKRGAFVGPEILSNPCQKVIN